MGFSVPAGYGIRRKLDVAIDKGKLQFGLSNLAGARAEAMISMQLLQGILLSASNGP